MSTTKAKNLVTVRREDVQTAIEHLYDAKERYYDECRLECRPDRVLLTIVRLAQAIA
jgi:hypothetical protein